MNGCRTRSGIPFLFIFSYRSCVHASHASSSSSQSVVTSSSSSSSSPSIAICLARCSSFVHSSCKYCSLISVFFFLVPSLSSSLHSVSFNCYFSASCFANFSVLFLVCSFMFSSLLSFFFFFVGQTPEVVRPSCISFRPIFPCTPQLPAICSPSFCLSSFFLFSFCFLLSSALLSYLCG